jgi:hypothetical protein
MATTGAGGPPLAMSRGEDRHRTHNTEPVGAWPPPTMDALSEPQPPAAIVPERLSGPSKNEETCRDPLFSTRVTIQETQKCEITHLPTLGH